jgi:hypothetical protein
MKTIDKIIVSSTPPKSKNVAWFDGKSIKMHSQGKWKGIGGSSDSSDIINIINSLYLSEMNDDFNNDFAI